MYRFLLLMLFATMLGVALGYALARRWNDFSVSLVVTVLSFEFVAVVAPPARRR